MKTKYLIILGIAAGVIIAGYFAWSFSRSEITDTKDNQAVPTATDTNAPTPTNSNTNTATSPTSGVLKYDDALALYAGRLFQFTSCVAGPPPVISPGSLSIKQGAKYMIDNRDKTAHTIRVGSTPYLLAAQSFRIISAPTKGTYNITCDGGGAAQLQVQP